MSERRTRTYEWDDPLPYLNAGLQKSGLEYMQAIANGELPMPPIGQTLDYVLSEASEGFAVFEGEPQEFHYNPIGTVHGGVAATLLDSAMGCAVHTTLPQGMGYGTVQLNVHLVRPITKESGRLHCEGRVIHSGRQMATAEATLTGADGRVYAHGTTTCVVFPLGNG